MLAGKSAASRTDLRSAGVERDQHDVALRRLACQEIAAPTATDATEVVAGFGAMQAQDYRNALWAVGLRTANATEVAIERAVADGQIVRTWPMRGTLHFVAAPDVHWMLELLTPRILLAGANRAAQLGLDSATLSRCGEICVEALADGVQLTREALLARIEACGIVTGPHRGYHILWRLAQQRLICFGPRVGKSPTFVLLDEWVPPKKRFTPKQPLTELAQRYFDRHGPATLQDFVWWSGLKVPDAKAGIMSAELSKEVLDGITFWSSPRKDRTTGDAPAAHLLPAFDEYLLGYRDRSAVLDPAHARKIVPGSNGIFLPFISLRGRVIGTWKRSTRTRTTIITAATFKRANRSVQGDLAVAVEAYSHFVGMPAELRFEQD